MQVFEFIVAIVAISLLFKLVQTVITQRHRRQESADPLAEELQGKIADLEERVRVLERIVTDKTSDLERQFRDLER